MVGAQSTPTGTPVILGCVGMQRHSDSKAELRRMSVSKAARRGGVARKLVRYLAAAAAAQVCIGTWGD
jgi:N-acetylglutamate synthase-like GNAT family acetyltransferase